MSVTSATEVTSQVTLSKLTPRLLTELQSMRTRVAARRCLNIPEGFYTITQLIRIQMTMQNYGKILGKCAPDEVYAYATVRKALGALMRSGMFISDKNKHYQPFGVNRKTMEAFMRSAYGESFTQKAIAFKNDVLPPESEVPFNQLWLNKNPYVNFAEVDPDNVKAGDAVILGEVEVYEDAANEVAAQAAVQAAAFTESEPDIKPNIKPDIKPEVVSTSQPVQKEDKMNANQNDLPKEFVDSVRELIKIMQEHCIDSVSCSNNGNVNFVRTVRQTVVTKIK